MDEDTLCPYEAELLYSVPHKCPVCDGTGKVSRPSWVPGDVAVWTDSSSKQFYCRACAGSGVLWRVIAKPIRNDTRP